MQYALSIGKPVMIIDAATHEVRRENWDRLAPGDPVLADLNELPDAESPWAQNPFNAPEHVFLFEQKCDYHATHGAPQFRRLIVSTVVAHITATLIAAATVAYGLHLLALPWAELACLTFALGAALVLRHHLHSHHSWVRCRLAAEFCRSALATWGLPRAAPLLQDLDLAGARRLTRALYILHTRSHGDPFAADRGIQADLPREAGRRPARLFPEAGKPRAAALQAAEGRLLVRDDLRTHLHRSPTR